MLYKISFYIQLTILILVFGSISGYSQPAGSLYSPKSYRNIATLSDLYTTGISIIDPVLPDTLIKSGLTLDEVHKRSKEGIEAVGWSQNQSSPYFLSINISVKSIKVDTITYSVEVDWGLDRSSLCGNPNGMGKDFALTKTIVLNGSNTSLILAAVNELSRRAAKKLQVKFYRDMRLQSNELPVGGQLGGD